MAAEAAQSLQRGYNHNIPHRGRLYHVQTEDSGTTKAHIFTHVFFDGTIIATNKVGYQDKLRNEQLPTIVVNLMQESHKSMIRALRSGKYDEKICEFIGPHPQALESRSASLSKQNDSVGEAPIRSQKPRAVPEPKDIDPQGPPLRQSTISHPMEPTLIRPSLADAASSSPNHRHQTAARGPHRTRRAIAGIGGQGVRADSPLPISERRDIIVGKFASPHQAKLDDEILALLREG